MTDAMGGPAANDVAVGVFYSKIINDSSIKNFFVNKDARNMKDKPRDFLIKSMGGPSGDTPRASQSARNGAQPKGLDETHVETVIGHLRATLEELRVPISVAAQILATAGDIRNEVFDRQRC